MRLRALRLCSGRYHLTSPTPIGARALFFGVYYLTPSGVGVLPALFRGQNQNSIAPSAPEYPITYPRSTDFELYAQI